MDHECEIGLIARHFQGIGAGEAVLSRPRSPQTSSDLANFVNWAVAAQGLEQQAEAAFADAVLPAILQVFPELVREPAHNDLYAKLKLVAFRAFTFHAHTARLRKTSTDPVLNICFSALYVIFDSLFDCPKYLDVRMPNRYQSLLDYAAGTFPTAERRAPMEELYVTLLQTIHERLPKHHLSLFKEISQKLTEVQLESILFSEGNFQLDSLRQNTFLRGGYATQLCLLLSGRSVQPEELAVFFLLGAPVQLGDDLGDVAEDGKEGLITLPRAKYASPADVWELYARVFELMEPLSKGNLYDVDSFSLFRGMIAFYLEKNIRLYERQV